MRVTRPPPMENCQFTQTATHLIRNRQGVYRPFEKIKKTLA